MIDSSSEAHTGKYESSLCGCDNIGNCCYVYFCYWCALGHAWADARGESCSCCHTLGNGMYVRANVNHARGMAPDMCSICCVYTCCPCCALSQDITELGLIKQLGPSKKGGSAPTSTVIINNVQGSAPQSQGGPPPGYYPPPGSQGGAPPPQQGYYDPQQQGAPQQPGYYPPPQGSQGGAPPPPGYYAPPPQGYENKNIELTI